MRVVTVITLTMSTDARRATLTMPQTLTPTLPAARGGRGTTEPMGRTESMAALATPDLRGPMDRMASMVLMLRCLIFLLSVSRLINHIFPVKSLESNQIKVVANSFLAPLVNLNNDTLDTVISLQSVVIFLTFLEIYIILE